MLTHWFGLKDNGFKVGDMEMVKEVFEKYDRRDAYQLMIGKDNNPPTIDKSKSPCSLFALGCFNGLFLTLFCQNLGIILLYMTLTYFLCGV